MGILVGDALLSRAYELLFHLPIDNHTRQLYCDMVNTTMYGQIQDVYLSHAKTLYSTAVIEQKDHAKSGHYTFMSPMLIGASLA